MAKKRPAQNLDPHWALIKPGKPRGWKAIEMTPDGRQEMPEERFVILLAEEGGYGLYRFAQDGEFAGDTLHATRTELQKHLKAAYGSDVGTWQRIPESISTGDHMIHLVDYVLSRLPKA